MVILTPEKKFRGAGPASRADGGYVLSITGARIRG